MLISYLNYVIQKIMKIRQKMMKNKKLTFQIKLKNGLNFLLTKKNKIKKIL